MDEDLLEEQDVPNPMKDRCPSCGSYDIRRSSSEGLVAAINNMLGRRPFRCRSCRRRFYRFAAPHPDI
jgi:hypothetical protein